MNRKRLEIYAALAFGLSALALAIAQPWAPSTTHTDIAVAQPAVDTTEPGQVDPAERPRIEVVFAIDTTASMSGLLEGAKAKVWSMANRLADGQPRPDIKFGLVAYRDIGDAYVTQRVPMTQDLDEVYDNLMGFQAGGGGDGPEHVNQALHDAIHGTQWSGDEKVLRLVFLVGDAPPHDDYDDGMTAAKLAQQAADKHIIINTVRCGGDVETERVWKQIAQLAHGEYASIAQDGGVVHVATPYDKELQELNAQLAGTVLNWGTEEVQRRAEKKVKNRYGMGAPAAAEAAGYAAKSGKMNAEDLIGSDKGIDDIDEAHLPSTLKGMSKTEQKAHVAKLRKDRAKIQKEILELSEKRDAYIDEAEEEAGVADGFDGQVLDAVRKQAADIGVAYE